MEKAQIEFARRTTALSRLVSQKVKLKRSGGGFLGCCPFHRDRNPSFHVSDIRQTYKCFSCGTQGDIFDWCMTIKGLTFTEAVTELSGGYVESTHPDLPDKIRIIRNTEREDDDRRIRHAHDLWLRREPIKGTVAERYLVTTRGIKGPISSILGHVPTAYCSVLGEETNALIAPLQDSHGHVTAVQQIFLSRETDDAWRDERGRRVKRTLGAMRDGAVRLGLPDRVLGMAGSVEDALAASWLYSLPVWATCGEHRMARVWVPEEITHLVIFADADDPGIKAAQEAKRVHQRGRQVTIMMPGAVKDWAGVSESRT